MISRSNLLRNLSSLVEEMGLAIGLSLDEARIEATGSREAGEDIGELYWPTTVPSSGKAYEELLDRGKRGQLQADSKASAVAMASKALAATKAWACQGKDGLCQNIDESPRKPTKCKSCGEEGKFIPAAEGPQRRLQEAAFARFLERVEGLVQTTTQRLAGMVRKEILDARIIKEYLDKPLGKTPSNDEARELMKTSGVSATSIKKMIRPETHGGDRRSKGRKQSQEVIDKARLLFNAVVYGLKKGVAASVTANLLEKRGRLNFLASRETKGLMGRGEAFADTRDTLRSALWQEIERNVPLQKPITSAGILSTKGASALTGGGMAPAAELAKKAILDSLAGMSVPEGVEAQAGSEERILSVDEAAEVRSVVEDLVKVGARLPSKYVGRKIGSSNAARDIKGGTSLSVIANSVGRPQRTWTAGERANLALSLGASLYPYRDYSPSTDFAKFFDYPITTNKIKAEVLPGRGRPSVAKIVQMGKAKVSGSKRDGAPAYLSGYITSEAELEQDPGLRVEVIGHGGETVSLGGGKEASEAITFEDNMGKFRFKLPSGGPYTLSFESSSYGDFAVKGLRLDGGEQTRIDIELVPEAESASDDRVDGPEFYDGADVTKSDAAVSESLRAAVRYLMSSPLWPRIERVADLAEWPAEDLKDDKALLSRINYYLLGGRNLPERKDVPGAGASKTGLKADASLAPSIPTGDRVVRVKGKARPM